MGWNVTRGMGLVLVRRCDFSLVLGRPCGPHEISSLEALRLVVVELLHVFSHLHGYGCSDEESNQDHDDVNNDDEDIDDEENDDEDNDDKHNDYKDNDDKDSDDQSKTLMTKTMMTKTMITKTMTTKTMTCVFRTELVSMAFPRGMGWDNS